MLAPDGDRRLGLQKRCNGWMKGCARQQCYLPADSCPHHDNDPGHPLWQLLASRNDLAALEAALLTGGAPLLHNLISRAAHPIWRLGPQHPIWQLTQEDLEQMEAGQAAPPYQGPAAEGRISSDLLRGQVNHGAGSQQCNGEELQGTPLPSRQQQPRREEEGMEEEGLLLQAVRREETSEEKLASEVGKPGGTFPEVVENQNEGPENAYFAFTLQSKSSGPSAGVTGAEAVTDADAAAIADHAAGGDAGSSSAAEALSTPTKQQQLLPSAANGVAASPGTPLQHPLAGGVRPQDSTIQRESDGPPRLSTGGHQEQQQQLPQQRQDVAETAASGSGPAGATAAVLASLRVELEGAREEARQARVAVEAAALDREGLLQNLEEAQKRAHDAWAEGAQTSRFWIEDLRHQLSAAKQQLEEAQQARERADAAADEVGQLRARLAAAERREREARAGIDAAVTADARLRRQLAEAQEAHANVATTKPDTATTIPAAVPAAVPVAATASSTDTGGLSALLGSVQAQLCSLAARAATQALLNLEAIPASKRRLRAAEPAAQAARGCQAAVDAMAVVTRAASEDEVERLRMELREARCTAAAMADQVARLQGSLEAAVSATADARSATDDSRRAALAGWAASQEALDLLQHLQGEYDTLARLREQLAAARRDVAAAQVIRSAAEAAAAAATAAGVRVSLQGATDDEDEASNYTGSSLPSATEATAASWEEDRHQLAGPPAWSPASAVPQPQIAATSGVQPPAGHTQQSAAATAAAEGAPYTHISIQHYYYGPARITAHF